MVNIDEIERENFVLRSSIEANGTLRRKKETQKLQETFS